MRKSNRLIALLLAVLMLIPALSAMQTEAEAIETNWTEPVILDYYADYDYEALLMSDGTLRVQGSDKDFVNELSRWTDVAKLRCSYNGAIAIRYNNTVLSAGFEDRVSKELSRWNDIYDVYVGSSFILGLKYDGTVCYVCYYESDEEFFDLDYTEDWENIVQIEIDGVSVVALDEDGQVYTLGTGGTDYQKQFDPDNITDGQIIWISEYINFCLHNNGKLSCWGIDEDIYDIKAINKEKLVEVLPGDTGSVGVRKDGSLVWLGEMADGDPREGFREEVNSCRNVASCSYSDAYENGGLYIVHKDGSVQVIAEEEGNRLEAAVERWDDVSQIYAKEFFACGLKADGSVRVATLYKNSLVDSGSQPAPAPESTSEPRVFDEYVDYYKCGEFEVALRSDGKVDAVGADEDELKELAKWENVEVLDGFNFMLTGITKDGRVLSIGFPENLKKQMDQWRDVADVFYWSDFAIALKKDGKMLVALESEESFFPFDFDALAKWKNIEYMVGNISPMQPVLVAMDKNGRVYNLDLDSGYPETDDAVNLTKRIRNGSRISTDGYINHCVLKDGSIESWGSDAYLLNKEMLSRKDYTHAIGFVGLKKDGSLCYLGRYGEMQIYDNDFIETVNSCKDVKMVYSVGDMICALKKDGSVKILDPGYHTDEWQEKALYAETAAWKNADTLEVGVEYLFMRDIAARICVWPESALYDN